MHLSFQEWLQETPLVSEGTQASPASQTPLLPQKKRKGHTPGEMNGLEKRYSLHLETEKALGLIQDWRFEPLKLLLAPKTTFTGDFVVKMPDGSLELRETKGWWEEDARLKIKWAAKDFRWMFSRIVGVKWERGDWQYEEF
jgi:hypothetical protein